MDVEPLVFVGNDWASTEHQVCLTGADGSTQRAFTHDANGICAMVDWLCAQAEQPQHVAVARDAAWANCRGADGPRYRRIRH